MVGFVSCEPNGHLDPLYVHPRFQRQGIAMALCEHIEHTALSRGRGRLFTEASITAHPFFERAGFRVLAPQIVTQENGSFTNYRMEKLFP
jgi:putative acetyltransferase